MKKPSRTFLLVTLLILILSTGACQQTARAPGEAPVTDEPIAPITETPDPRIGSSDHPVRLIFAPSAEAEVVQTGGQIVADALHQATGLTFQVFQPAIYSEITEELCARPPDAVGFVTGLTYVLANHMCGAEVSFKAMRAGYDKFWTEILVRRDSGITSLAELEGRKWAYGDPGFTTDYLAPLIMFNESGVTPGQQIQTGSHRKALVALYNGEVDFVTTYFSPPTYVNTSQVVWSPESPDIPEEIVASCGLGFDDNLVCGSLQVNDARVSIRKVAPDVIQRLRILGISSDLPNDAVAFSPDFPPDVRVRIESALTDLSNTQAWKESLGSQDFFHWSGIAMAKDSDYDIIRSMTGMIWPELGVASP